MTAELLICLAGVSAFGVMATLLVPSNWNPDLDDEGEAVAEIVFQWWHRYRTYRKVVSGEYSRHDGTQVMRHPRRYYSLPPAFPAEAVASVNYWFDQVTTVAPAPAGRHLALVSA